MELQHFVFWYKLLSYLSLFLCVCVCIFESDHAVGQKEEKEKNMEGLD